MNPHRPPISERSLATWRFLLSRGELYAEEKGLRLVWRRLDGEWVTGVVLLYL